MRGRFYKLFSFISVCSLYGLLFFIPISISFIEVFSTLIFFGFVGRKIIKPDFKFLRSFPNIALLFFLFFSAASLWNSGPYIALSIKTLLVKWSRYILLCFVLQDAFYNSKTIRRGLFIFLCGALLAIVSGLFQYLFGFDLIFHHPLAETPFGWYAVTSSFNYYNDFGAYLVITLSLTTGLLVSGKYSGLKACSLFAFSIFGTVIILLTFSRGSWIAMACSLVAISVFIRKNIWGIASMAISAAIMLLLPDIRERLFSIFGAGGDSFRFVYWKSALNMIKAHPFMGVGLGTFMQNYGFYLPGFNGIKHTAYAHNFVLQIWAESGVFALVSFLSFIVGFFYVGIRTFIGSRYFPLLGLLAGILGFLVHSLLDTGLYSLQLSVLFWTWVGLALNKRLSISKGAWTFE